MLRFFRDVLLGIPERPESYRCLVPVAPPVRVMWSTGRSSLRSGRAGIQPIRCG